VHPIVVFEAIDARPYAFAVLSVNCAILGLLRWLRTHERKYAILLGSSSALAIYFHFLFGVILGAFALVLLARMADCKRHLAGLGLGLVSFLLLMVPVAPRFALLFQSRGTHVFEQPPVLDQFIHTIAPYNTLALFVLTLFLALIWKKISRPEEINPIAGATSLLLGVIPLAILYLVSSQTSIHVFVVRYRLVAVPGIALCWAFLLNHIESKYIRQAFCAVMLIVAAQAQFQDPTHSYSWRDAIVATNKNIAADHAPVLICSDLPESNYSPMPADPLQSSWFAELSYYKLQSPLIVPLPREVNQETEAQLKKFLARPGQLDRRFLVMAFHPSWPTLDWMAKATEKNFVANTIGVYDGVAVVEYIPKTQQTVTPDKH
jgi:hypothetical protein